MVLTDIQIFLQLGLVFLGFVAGLLAFLLYPASTDRDEDTLKKSYEDSIDEFEMLFAINILAFAGFILFASGIGTREPILTNIGRVLFILPLLILVVVLGRWWRRFGW
jgi:hypothetical protein